MGCRKRVDFKSVLSVLKIIMCLLMLTTFVSTKVSADDGKVSVIKIDGSSSPRLNNPNYYIDYYYIYRAVKNGVLDTSINGLYGNYYFNNGISQPTSAYRAINLEYQYVWNSDSYVVGMPQGTTLECIDVRVKEKNTNTFKTLAEAGISESAAMPYPTFATPQHYDSIDIILPGQSDILWASFKLVNEAGEIATNLTGTYGDMTFTNGLSSEGDPNRSYSYTQYDDQRYCEYLMGHEDIFILTGLPEGIHVEVMTYNQVDVCWWGVYEPKILHYPMIPFFDYKIQHYLGNDDNSEYTLDVEEVFQKEMDSTILAADYVKDYAIYSFNATKSDVSGVVSSSETLVLKLYYDKNPSADYTVNEYFQNDDLTTYSLSETNTLQGVIGSTVKANIVDYYMRNFNSEKSTSEGIVMADGSLVLDLYYDYITYTLSYDVGDAIGSIPDQIIPISKYVYVANPSDYGVKYPGYTFDYWYEDYSSDEYTIGDGFNMWENKTLYAQWSQIDDPDLLPYYVNHQYKQEDGSYSGYPLEYFDYEGETVTATPRTNEEYYVYNPDHPNTKLSGTVTANPKLNLSVFYDPKDFTLSYDGNGHTSGNVPDSVVGNIFSKIEVEGSEGFEKDGYSFVCWENQYGFEYSKGSEVDGLHYDMVLKAQWRKVEKSNYIVEYYLEDANGNHRLAEHDVLSAEIGTTVNAVEKSFEHYLLNNTRSIKSGVVSATETLVLQLIYDLNDYTLSYDGNGATSGDAPANEVGNMYTNITIADNPFEKDGFTFDGWKDQNNVAYSEKEVLNGLTEDLVLYAQWKDKEKPTYIVYHFQEDLNGGYNLIKTEELTASIGSAVNADVMTLPHYTLNASRSKLNGVVPSIGTLFLNVYYDLDKHTLDYYGNGADSGNMNSRTEKYSKEFDLDQNSFKKEGFEFIGWNTKIDGSGTAYKDKDHFKMLEDTDLYAQWEEKDEPIPPAPVTKHTITYKLDGGTYKGNPNDIVQSHELGSTIIIHEAPDAREGYEFDYWQGSIFYPGQEYKIEGDHTFTAKWKKIEDDPKKEKKYIPPSTGVDDRFNEKMLASVALLSSIYLYRKKKNIKA